MPKRKKSRDHQTSKGERRSVSAKSTRNPEYSFSSAEMLNKLDAFKKSKNVMLTIPNPDPKNTKERMIRVPASSVWNSDKGPK